MMDSEPEDSYQSAAEYQLRFVGEYCPAASAILEKIRPCGSKALFQAAFTVALYKSILEFMGGIPEQFDYYCYIDEFPQIMPLLDQAISCLLEDWLCGNLKSEKYLKLGKVYASVPARQGV